MAKTEKPKNLKVTRSRKGYIDTYTFEWKQGDDDYGDGQQASWRVFVHGKDSGKGWMPAIPKKSKKASKDMSISKTATKCSQKIDIRFNKNDWIKPSNNKYITSIRFAVRGNRKAYKKTKGKGKDKKEVTINPSWSEWVTTIHKLHPPATPKFGTQDTTIANRTKFPISAKVSDSDARPFTRIYWDSVLVNNNEKGAPTTGSKVNFNKPDYKGTSAIGKASVTVDITENSNLSEKGSFTRWVRARSEGYAGVSEWAYAKRTFATPKQAIVIPGKNTTAKPIANGSALSVSVTWKAASTRAYPIDEVVVKYAIAIPTSSMGCPDDASWQDARSPIYDTTKWDRISFEIDRDLEEDEVLFVRVYTKHDTHEVPGVPTIVRKANLKAPTINSITPNIANRSVSMSVTNNSQVPGTYIEVYMAIGKKTHYLGDIPAGQTSKVFTNVPNWSQSSKISFSVKAVLKKGGSNAMQSATRWQGESIPVTPQHITVRQGANSTTAVVTWTWSWDACTHAELSWADHNDAWNSTDEPNTYSVSRLFQNVWNITGLEAGKIWYFRVRLYQEDENGTTYGPYSDIKELNLSTVPDTPTIQIQPESGIIPADGKITVNWGYTTVDGAEQIYAEVCEATLDATGAVKAYGKRIAHTQTAQHITINAASASVKWAVGTTHAICVRVKSGSGNTSAWSYPAVIKIADSPSCEIVQHSLRYKEITLDELKLDGTSVTFTTTDPVNLTDCTVTIPTEENIVWDSITFNHKVDNATRSYTINFKNEIGSITGGTYDLVTGKLITNNSTRIFYGYPVVAPANTRNTITAVVTGTRVEYLSENILSESSETLTDENGSILITDGPIRSSTTVTRDLNLFVDGYSMLGTFLCLTTLPLTVTAEGAGEGGQTRLIVERAESYAAYRPDESILSGYEGETIVNQLTTGETQFSVDQPTLLGQFDDGASYRMIASVTDEFGQVAETEPIEFRVNWDHQATAPTALVSIVEDNLHALITPIAPEGTIAGDVCDIYRLTADRPMLIIQNAQFGMQYVDPYPTLGDFGGYRVVFKTLYGDYITPDNRFAMTDYDSGDAIVDAYQVMIDFDGERVVLPYDIDLSNDWSKDFTETKYLGGSVQGDWNATVSRTGSIGTTVIVENDPILLEGMRRLAVHTGPCLVRTPDGSTFVANVNASESREMKWTRRVAKFTLDITRVDADGMFGGLLYSNFINQE